LAIGEKQMGWAFIAVGIVLVICGNVRGAYHKDRTPKKYVRIALTFAGIGLVCVGIHYLGVGPF
jgi:VIT1/CCC1 family predicted Fe2+/Mn2+ transporter